MADKDEKVINTRNNLQGDNLMRAIKLLCSILLCVAIINAQVFTGMTALAVDGGSGVENGDAIQDTVQNKAEGLETKKITVNFDLNGVNATVIPDAQVDVAVSSKIEKPAVAGYTTDTEEYVFLGWSLIKSGEGKETYWDFDNSIEANTTVGEESTAITLYAQWQINDLFSSGTEQAPFKIKNTDMLSRLAENVNNGKSYKDCYFQLATDILLTDSWIAIGNESSPFSGYFDGLNHTIKGLSIKSDNSYQGLFGVLSGAQIKNLAVMGDITGNEYIGAVAGIAQNNTIISNCYSSANIQGNNKIAGIVGANDTTSYQANCFTVGSITTAASGITLGAITSENAENNINCYYLDTSVVGAVDNQKATACTKEEFTNGHVAYLLDNGGSQDRTMLWSQGETHPIFAEEDNKAVYKLSIDKQGNGTTDAPGYAKAGQLLEIAINADIDNIIKLFSVSDGNSIIAEGSGSDKCTFTMPERDIILTINIVKKTAEEFKVTFNANGGHFVEGEEVQNTKETIIAAGNKVKAEMVIPTKENSEDVFYNLFTGWYIDEECTKPYNYNEAVTENLILYAKWVPVREVNIVFDGNVSETDIISNIPERQKVVKTGDNADKILAVDNPEREKSPIKRHDLLGWSLIKSGEGSDVYWDFDTNMVSKIVSTENGENPTITLYAQWKTVDLFTTGTESEPFKVKDTFVLSKLAEKVNSGNTYENCYFELATSLDLSEFTQSWIPIGNGQNPFKGHFSAGLIVPEPPAEENGFKKLFSNIKNFIFGEEEIAAQQNTDHYYTISGLTIEGTVNYSGLFGNVAGGSIKNLAVYGTVKGGDYTGGIAGYVGSGETIENCISNVIVSGRNSVGGVVGKTEDKAFIKNCINTQSISGTNLVGGIAGEMGREARIVDCKNLNDITGTKKVAGLVGEFTDEITAIVNSYNTGKITGKDNTAGLVGSLNGTIPDISVIRNCYNTGTITGSNYTGGLIGQIGSKTPVGDSISNCYNAGNINSDGSYVGGITAYLPKGSRISNCYNVGSINSTKASVSGVGGITGFNYVNSSSAVEIPSSYVVNCYNYGTISAVASQKVGAITGWIDTNKFIGFVNKNEGCYYLDFAVKGISKLFDANENMAKTTEQFASGEVAFLLDKGQSYPRLNNWSQGSNYPIFADEGNLQVYKITINENFGGTVEKVGFGKAGTTVAIDAIPDTNYIINKAVVTDSENTKYMVNIDNSTITFQMPEDNISVDVSFISKPPEGEFTITFDSNGGSKVEKQVIVAGGRVIIPEAPVFEGKNFTGWYLDGELYDFSSAIVSDITLQAGWSEENIATVSFNVNRPDGTEGSVAPEPITINKGDTVTQPSSPVWNSKSAIVLYKFDGWYTKKSGGEKWNFNYPINSNMTLYARWIEMDGLEGGITPDKAVVINSVDELAQLANNVNTAKSYEDLYFKLGQNIDLSDFNTTWESIGFHNNISTPAQIKSPTPQEGSKTFQGHFDGGGYTITLQSNQMYPLFGCIGVSGSVSNLNVKAVLEPNANRQCFGGIVGFNFGELKNCNADIDTTNKELKGFNICAGGISGVNVGNILDCTAKVVLNGGQYTGGISGLFKYNEINNCTLKSGSEINSTGGMSGGIVGCMASTSEDPNEQSIIRNCVTEVGTVITGTASSIGGIVGHAVYDIRDCTNNATVETTNNSVAGIVGYQGAGRLSIERCINAGSISGTDKIGGLVGSAGTSTVRNCYSTGNVTATKGAAGGLLGSACQLIQSCYWYGHHVMATTDAAAICPVDIGDKMDDCYYVSSTDLSRSDEDRTLDDSNGNARGMSADDFTNGKVAYLLDRANGTKVWTLDGLSIGPVFGSPHYYIVSGIIAGEITAGTLIINSPDTKVYEGNTAYTAPQNQFKVDVQINQFQGEVEEGHYAKYVLDSLILVQNGISTNIENGSTFRSVDGDSLVTATLKVEKGIIPDVGGGNGNSDGTGTGNGSGTGDGTGTGDGSGTGDGTGTGTGDGSGTGDGTGTGTGDGSGTGDGTGTGDGDGIGTGTGGGAGSGTGQGEEDIEGGGNNGGKYQNNTDTVLPPSDGGNIDADNGSSNDVAINNNSNKSGTAAKVKEENVDEEINQETVNDNKQDSIKPSDKLADPGESKNDETKKDNKISVFEVVQDVAKQNPWVVALVGCMFGAVLIVGATWQYRKLKK